MLYRLPDNLYCVGGDVKLLNQSITKCFNLNGRFSDGSPVWKHICRI